MTNATRYSLVTLATLTGLSIGAGQAFAQGTRDQLLVSVSWLAEHLNDPHLVLLHVGAENDYAAEHIPGARYVTHSQLATPHSDAPGALMLELPEPGELQQKLRSLGISQQSRIVVYWGSEWVTPSTRVVFTLDWVGLGSQTVLLDGGIDAWKAAGHAVTADVPTPAPGDVTVSPRPELVVTADWVGANSTARGVAVIDGRAPEFYAGTREDRGKAGHVPGAGSLPWRTLVNDALQLKDPESLRQLFRAAGVEEGDTVVAYCHIGQVATSLIFAARTLGHPVKLFDGSFQDWASRNLPVEASKP